MKVYRLAALKPRFERQGFELTMSPKTGLLHAYITTAKGRSRSAMATFYGIIEAGTWIDGFECAREIYDDTEEAK